MFKIKNSRDRLKEHFVFRLDEASNKALPPSTIEAMAESLVLLSPDTMALTHEYMVTEAPPLDDSLKTDGDLGIFSTVNLSLLRERTEKFGRAAEKGIGLGLNAFRGAISTAKDSYHAARVSNSDELLEATITLIDKNNNQFDIVPESKMIDDIANTMNLPNKWAKVIYFKAMATTASRSKS